VHPTKIEVRFRDSREVHQAVRRAVEAALSAPRAALEGGRSRCWPSTGARPGVPAWRSRAWPSTPPVGTPV
jgi:DNA mismatch repair protein MutL